MFCKILLINNGVWICGSVWLVGFWYFWIGMVFFCGVELVCVLLCVIFVSFGFVFNMFV